MNYDQFIDEFFKFEKEQNLIDLEYEGVKVWVLARNRIFSNIAHKLELLQTGEYTVTDSKVKRVWYMLKYLSRAFINIFIPVKKADIIVFNHPRKVLKNGAYLDIYTQWYIDSMHKENKSVLVIDSPLNWNKHLIAKDSSIRNIENFGVLRKIIAKYARRKELPIQFDEISKQLIELFGSDGHLKKEIATQFDSFIVDERYYTKLIKKSDANKVVYVVKNSMHSLISASNTLNIPVWEIQHGVMGRHNIMYSYEGRDTVPYFPDGMYLMSKLWLDRTPMPLGLNDVLFYETDITKDDEEEIKNNKAVILLSQPTVATQLVSFLETNITNSNYEYIFKLHPTEFALWRQLYPNLSNLDHENSNLTVVDSFTPNLDTLLKSSTYLVGVNSTSILEGMYRNVKPFILNTSGASLMTDLFDKDEYIRVEIDEYVEFKSASEGIKQVDKNTLFYKV